MTDTEQILDRLISLARAAAAGDFAEVDELLAMAGSAKVPKQIAELAEAFGMLIVEVEAREFALNCTIGELERTRVELEHANYDPLTGLPNRAIFHDRLRRAVVGAKAERHKMALMFVDLDHFKEVNDNWGHDAGDELLRVVAARLSACVRADDLLARLGGDEFTVILPNVDSEATAAEVAQRIVATLSAPVPLKAGLARIGASVGVALLPAHADTPEDLLKRADAAMYRAKEKGRNNFIMCTNTHCLS